MLYFISSVVKAYPESAVVCRPISETIPQRSGRITVLVGGNDSGMEVAPGDEAAAGEQPELADMYAFFPQKDFIPSSDGSAEQLPIEVRFAMLFI